LANAGIPAKQNKTSDNWYYNNTIHWRCDRGIFEGEHTLRIDLGTGNIADVSILDKLCVNMYSARHHIIEIIKNMIQEGYYVAFDAIAYECPFHHKHILNQNVFVEETQDGEILVTSLQNKAVPLIRYSLGDRVHIESENCACGYEGKTIKIFEGRTTDRIKLENNSYIDPYVFLYCIEKTNLILNNSIIQYKIIQPDIDNIVMSIVLDKNYTHWSAAIIDELKKNIQNVINFQNININVNVNVVERVNNFGSEKFKIFETYI